MQDASDLPTVIAAAGAGLVFGSFVGALSYRLPRHINISTDRSRCTSCGHVLAARDLVPVVSWFMHKGRCAYCGARISPRYPAIELTSMALFTASAILRGDPGQLVLLLAMIPPLLTLAVIDLEHRQLPNVLVGILASLLAIWRWREGGNLLAPVGLSTIVVVLVVATGFVARKLMPKAPPLLGGGDGKLLVVAAVGLSLPRYFSFLAMAGLLGCIFGAAWLWRTRETRFPFGPAIVLALWLTLSVVRFLPF